MGACTTVHVLGGSAGMPPRKNLDFTLSEVASDAIIDYIIRLRLTSLTITVCNVFSKHATTVVH